MLGSSLHFAGDSAVRDLAGRVGELLSVEWPSGHREYHTHGTTLAYFCVRFGVATPKSASPCPEVHLQHAYTLMELPARNINQQPTSPSPLRPGPPTLQVPGALHPTGDVQKAAGP